MKIKRKERKKRRSNPDEIKSLIWKDRWKYSGGIQKSYFRPKKKERKRNKIYQQ
jgi:hypothetical protein